MAQIRKTSFVTLLSADIRRRHEHLRMGNQIISFVTQIELLVDERWMPVARYDTAHGFAHRDLISPSGRVEKTPLFVHNFNEALEFAEADLKSNWKRYVESFLRERENKP